MMGNRVQRVDASVHFHTLSLEIDCSTLAQVCIKLQSFYYYFWTKTQSMHVSWIQVSKLIYNVAGLDFRYLAICYPERKRLLFYS